MDLGGGVPGPFWQHKKEDLGDGVPGPFWQHKKVDQGDGVLGPFLGKQCLDQGVKMEFREKTVHIPLVLGVISIILLGIYLWDAYHLRSSLMLGLCVIPLSSGIGLIFSIITAKILSKHKAIWIAGFLSCLISLLGFLVIEGLTWYYLGLALG